MSIFKPAENLAAFLKAGFYGAQNSGKTYIAVDMAIGLHKHIKAKKPIMFLDTETGSDWAIPKCKEAGIKLEVAKTRAFKNLISGMHEAQENASVLIIDSLTHFWKELIKSYIEEKKPKGGRMSLLHWGKVLPIWDEFSDLYVNSKLHVIICGRSGWNWGHEEDEEGIKELVKTGTKMKAGGEIGYEPNLLVEMEAIKGKAKGDKFVHRAFVLKDRRMDDKSLVGKSFDEPIFKDFLSHVEYLNIGGKHKGYDDDTSKEIFITTENKVSWEDRQKEKAICLEEIEGTIKNIYPGSTNGERNYIRALKKHVFGTYSGTAIEECAIEKLRSGLKKITKILHDPQRDEIINKIIEELKQQKIEEEKSNIKSNISTKPRGDK